MTALPVRRCLIVSTAYADAPRGKLRALGARGVEVTVAVPQRWPEPVTGRLHETTWERQHGVEVFPVPVRGTTAAIARFDGRGLTALLRDKRPDLVQIEDTPGDALPSQAADAAHRAGLPTVLCTSANVRWPGGLLASLRRRRALRRARGAMAESSAAAALLAAIRADLPVGIVPPHGVTVPPDPLHTPHEGQHVGYVGRLEARRGLDTLLHALASRRGEAWRLTVVGDGPERERFERLASELRIAARIRWMGAIPAAQVLTLWPELDVLAHPARRADTWEEPHGDVVAEAMGHAVAVVATASGVLPEVIGDAGLLVPPGNVAGLADALGLLAEPAAHRAYADAARARALELFTDDAIAERTLTFWHRVLA